MAGVSVSHCHIFSYNFFGIFVELLLTTEKLLTFEKYLTHQVLHTKYRHRHIP